MSLIETTPLKKPTKNIRIFVFSRDVEIIYFRSAVIIGQQETQQRRRTPFVR